MRIKPVVGLEGYYEVDEEGGVYSLPRVGRKIRIKLMGNLDSNGYVIYNLGIRSSYRKSFSAHRLVATAFIPNPENKPTVNHKNGIKNDNRVENLEWNTILENNVHAYTAGLKKAIGGEKHYKTKFTEEDVIKIRTDPRNATILGKEYSARPGTITQIKRRETWKHVP